MFSIVDGTSARPAAAGADQTAWDRGNNEAITAMMITMSDQELEGVSNCKTAEDIWKRLEMVYANTSGQDAGLLWSQFYAIMAGPKSPVKTMLTIQNLASQLRGIGQGVTEEMEVTRIILSLKGPKFQALREAWRSVDPKLQTTGALLARLKTWELEEGISGQSQEDAADEVQARAYSAHQPRRLKKFNGRPKKTKEELAELKKRTKCHSCKETGHWKTECPNKDKKHSHEDSDEYAAAYMAGGESDHWINDSGATRHFCGRLDWFKSYELFPVPRSVNIADNSTMMALGCGTVPVNAFINGRWKVIELTNVDYVPGSTNLFSENVLLAKGFQVRKSGDPASIVYYRNGRADIEAEFRKGVQVMKFKPVASLKMATAEQLEQIQLPAAEVPAEGEMIPGNSADVRFSEVPAGGEIIPSIPAGKLHADEAAESDETGTIASPERFKVEMEAGPTVNILSKSVVPESEAKMVEQPWGQKIGDDLVCKLEKSLYESEEAVAGPERALLEVTNREEAARSVIPVEDGDSRKRNALQMSEATQVGLAEENSAEGEPETPAQLSVMDILSKSVVQEVAHQVTLKKKSWKEGMDENAGRDTDSDARVEASAVQHPAAPERTWTSREQMPNVIMYVDDGIVLANQKKELEEALETLKEISEISIQPMNQVLGVEAQMSSYGNLIDQPKYPAETLDVLLPPGLQLEAISVLADPKERDRPTDILSKSVVRGKVMEMQTTGTKCKALSSVVSDSKRPNLFWTAWTVLMLITMGMASDIHNSSPVLWRKNTDPVVIGFNAIKMTIKMVNPCTLIPMDNIDGMDAKIMDYQCRKTYEDLFLSKLERMCPKVTNGFALSRKRRELITIGIIFLVVVASAGVGIGGFAMSKTFTLETKQDELKNALDDLERRVFIKDEEVKLLQSEIHRITSNLDDLTNDFHRFKENSIETHYFISYLTSRLMEGKKALHETEKIWRKGELSEDFFDYLNFTLPCGDSCPVEHGIFHSCVMKEDRTEVILDISVPIVNQSLTRVEADPFDIMVKENNSTCRLKYTGPTLATLSVEEDCVYETYLKNPKNRLALVTSQRCTNESSFKKERSYYKVSKCMDSKPGDEKDFIQVKIFNNQYYIYCPGTVYAIGKRQVECPQKVFTPPLSLSFTLNNVEYQGNVLKIVYREREDPVMTEHINFHLNPRVDWSNLTAEIDDEWTKSEGRFQEEARRIPVFKFEDDGIGWKTVLLALMIGLALTACTVVGFGLYLKNKKPQPKKQMTPEEIPLQEGPMSSHRIIIET